MKDFLDENFWVLFVGFITVLLWGFVLLLFREDRLELAEKKRKKKKKR